MIFLIKKKEIELFREIRNFFSSKQENRINQVDWLLKKYKIEVSLIPSSRLPVICVQNGSGVNITSLGEIILTLYKILEELKIEGYIFLTAGAAKEALGIKPQLKSRIRKGRKITLENYYPKTGAPIMDGDFILIIDNKKMTEKTIERLLKADLVSSPLDIRVINTKLRSFTRVDIGKLKNGGVFDEDHWALSWESYGQISFPKYKNYQSSSIPLLLDSMSFDSSYPYILLIPGTRSEGFIGIRVNFFPQHSNSPKIFYEMKSGQVEKYCELNPTIIFWPEVVFPFDESPTDALTKLVYLLRSVTWDDQLPLVNDNGDLSKILISSFEGRLEEIKEVSEKTSQYLANKIVYQIAENPDLVADEPIAMRKITQRTMKSIKSMLNGSPYLGLIYLLAAGENPTDAPVYGTGIIDPKGFFTELYEFLHQGDRLDKLIRLMAETEEGPAMKGWPAFLNFIYRETDRNFKKTVELLNPKFCSIEIYPTLVADFIKDDLLSKELLK
ncbi:MAG: hypothetical protein ACOX50_00440 [Patescibacteria group bacterium]